MKTPNDLYPYIDIAVYVVAISSFGFLFLKLTNTVNWPWLWVLSPLLLFGILFLDAVIVAALVSRHQNAKNIKKLEEEIHRLEEEVCYIESLRRDLENALNDPPT